MGGAEAALSSAREAFDAGDYRWVAEVANHLVFAEPENAEARELQADALEQLGYGAENATWRNFFLMGAQELRDGVSGTPTATAPPTSLPASASSSSSTRWRSDSTGRGHGAGAADRLGRHRPRRGALIRVRNGVLTTVAAATKLSPTRRSSSSAPRSTSCC